MAKLIRPDGSESEVFPKDPARNNGFSLEELRAFVGGPIEIVTVDSKTLMVCNEDGRNLGLASNPKATEIYQKVGGVPGWDVVGNVLIAAYPQEVS